MCRGTLKVSFSGTKGQSEEAEEAEEVEKERCELPHRVDEVDEAVFQSGDEVPSSAGSLMSHFWELKLERDLLSAMGTGYECV